MRRDTASQATSGTIELATGGTMLCHQLPSMTVVMHHLGLFYYWHIYNVIPTIGRIVCR